MRRLNVILLLCLALRLTAGVNYTPDMYSLIVQDIYEELTEEWREPDLEQLTEDLARLHEEPLNLNDVTAEDLGRLRFLSDRQIDDILLFVYKRPMNSLYELRLVPSLADYEIRNMLPFVCVAPVRQQEHVYIKEVLHYARHEIHLRLDANNIENNGNDPFHCYLRYRFAYKQKVEAGIVLDRDPHEPFYYPQKTYGADFYGGYLQLNDIGCFKTIVAGDYRACFGQGLVINTDMTYGGKTQYMLGKGFRQEGLRRKSSAAEYDFLRGIGATMRWGIADISVFYSGRKPDGKVENGVFSSIQHTGLHRTDTELQAKRGFWQHIAGANVTLRLKHARIGITATENILSDTLRAKPTYYNANYFTGIRQFAAGVNFNWQLKRVTLFGEAATAQNTKWGFAGLAGIKVMPVNEVNLTAIYRYYSRHYDNMLASSLLEVSRLNDEQGLYLGAEVNPSRRLRLAAYADIFRFSMPKYGIKTPSEGFDIRLSANYMPDDNIDMQWLFRCKRKGEADKYSLRYTLNAKTGCWQMRTGMEGNIVKKQSEKPTLGGVIYEQVEYHARSYPLVVQLRLEAFSAHDYDNRIYTYENDVLYVFSVPAMYGAGGRWYVNFRYSISKHVSLYLKAAETIFTDRTMSERGMTSRTRTDIHALLRIRL